MSADQARYILPATDAAATPRSDVVPDELVFRFPAHHAFMGCPGSVLETTLALVERDVASGRDVQAAVRSIAGAVIARARPWTPVEVSIVIDDSDVFVRSSAELLDPTEPPQLGDHARATLRRNVESFEVLLEEGRMFAVLQVSLEPPAG